MHSRVELLVKTFTDMRMPDSLTVGLIMNFLLLVC